MNINRIIEEKWILQDIQGFGILKQYKKCKTLLFSGNFKNIDLKKRQPKSEDAYQFRISKKYRAICYVEEDELRVVRIDKHQ